MFSFVLAVFTLFAVSSNGIVLGEVEKAGGESRCGIVDTLLWSIRHAQQAESPQDTANRILILTDTYKWSEYCVQGECVRNMGALIEQFSRESRVIDDMSFTNIRSEYGRSWARSTLTLSLVDRCGDTYEPINALYSFYCNGEQGHATAIHVIYDEVPFIVMQQKLKECERKMEQKVIEEQRVTEDTSEGQKLPDPVQTEPFNAQPNEIEGDEEISEIDDTITLPIAQTPEPLQINE